MEKLVSVVQDLSQARNMEHIMAVVRTAARDLTGADGAAFVLRDGTMCHYADEDAIMPLWKGQRFPMNMCISGWVMMNAQSVIIEDIFRDPRIPADAYRPTFVRSLAMVPIRQRDPLGAIGNYWAHNHMPTDEEVTILQALADVTSIAIENTNLYSLLQQKLTALEQSNHELSRFAWVASHDLKSPLRSVDNLAQCLEEDLGVSLQENSRGHLRSLRQQVQRMGKLLDEVLDYAHIETRMDPGMGDIVDGETLFHETLALTNPPSSFKVSVNGCKSTMRTPRMPLQQILCNLITNCVKHHDKTEGAVNISVEDDRLCYHFTVSDDGPGISPERQGRIFDIAQTPQPHAQRDGGIGLALVKKILLSYGSDIALESGPRGTTFRFTWPKMLEYMGGKD